MSNNKTLSEEAVVLLKCCELGDVFGKDGPALLEYAAGLLAQGAPHVAFALKRKAEAERAAITIARKG